MYIDLVVYHSMHRYLTFIYGKGGYGFEKMLIFSAPINFSFAN